MRRFQAIWLGFLSVSVFLLLCPCLVMGAGYAILEQSVGGLGSAYVGSSVGAHGLADLFFNPAVLSLHGGRHAVFSSSCLEMSSQFTLKTASNCLGQAVPGNPGGANIARPALIPALYATQDLRGPWRFALGVNVPWGLQSRNPAGWVGRYHGLESKVETVNINPMVARRLNDRLSFGLGLQAQRMNAHLTSAVDFGTIGRAAGVPGAIPGAQDGSTALDGDDWGYGYTLGLMWEPCRKTRIGAGFRSLIRHELEGGVEFTYDSTGMGRTLAGLTGAFRSGPVTADVTTPDILSLGVQHELGARWNLTAEARRYGWSRFGELRVKFGNPAQMDDVTEEAWKDAWSWGLGFQYKADRRWTLRTGICIEESPVPDRTRNPRIPDSDRRWIAVGASYQASQETRWDFGFSRLFFDEAPINLSAADVGSTFRGNLQGDFANAIDLLGIQVETLF